MFGLILTACDHVSIISLYGGDTRASYWKSGCPSVRILWSLSDLSPLCLNLQKVHLKNRMCRLCIYFIFKLVKWKKYVCVVALKAEQNTSMYAKL